MSLRKPAAIALGAGVLLAPAADSVLANPRQARTRAFLSRFIDAS